MDHSLEKNKSQYHGILVKINKIILFIKFSCLITLKTK